MALKFLYRLTVSSLICLTLAGSAAFSQQENHYLMEDIVPFRNNPAYTGDRDLNDLIIMTRQQWTGFEGAPTSYLLATHFVLRDKNAAIGADIQNNTLGPVKETRIFLNYSYRVVLGENTFLCLGLKGGIGILQINLSDLRVIDQGDNLFESNVDNIILPNVGSGLHFVCHNYYFDLSIPKILRNKLSPKGVQEVSVENREDRVVITGGGAKFRIADEIFLHPSFAVWLVKGATPLFETRISTTTRKVGIGLVYRPLSATGGYFDYAIWDQIRIGYAYELPISMLKGALSSSHEVYIGYNFSLTKRKIISPRKF